MMKETEFKFYKTVQGGALKFIKTNNRRSQVIMKIDCQWVETSFPYPYPMWDEFEQDEIKEKEYKEALAEVEK